MMKLWIIASMKDLCYDVFGVAKEKKDPRQVKGNRELLDVLPEKRKFEYGRYSSDDGDEEDSSYKKHKKAKKADYEEWRSTVLSSNKKVKAKDFPPTPAEISGSATVYVKEGREKPHVLFWSERVKLRYLVKILSSRNLNDKLSGAQKLG